MQPWPLNHGFVLAIRSLLSITAVLQLVIVAGDWINYGLAREDVQLFEDPGMAAVNVSFEVSVVVSILALVMLAVGVVFMVWMCRVAMNNEALGRPGRTFDPGWAITGWFIPLANFVIPILHLQELWQGSDSRTPRGQAGWRAVAHSRLLWIWWLCFIGSGIMYGIAMSPLFTPDINSAPDEWLDALTRQLSVLTFAHVGLAVAAVLCCVVVGQLTKRQDNAFRVRWTQPGEPLAPLAPDPAALPTPAKPRSEPRHFGTPHETSPDSPPWRHNTRVVLAVRILVCVAAVVGVLTIPLSFNARAATEDDVLYHTAGTNSDVNDAAAILFLAILVWVVVYLAAAIVFMVWMCRAAMNNEALGRPGRTFGPGWATGGWFIPLANYVIPILHLQQLWQGSDSRTPPGWPGWRAVAHSRLLWIWWLCFIGPGILNGFAFYKANTSANGGPAKGRLDAITMAVNLTTVAYLGLAVGAVLCCVVVDQLTKRQDDTARTHGLL